MLLQPALVLPLAFLAPPQAPSVVDPTPTPPPTAPVPLLADESQVVSGSGTVFADAGSGRGQALVDIVGPDPAAPGDPSAVGPPDGVLDLVQVNSNSPALPLSAPPGQEVTPPVGQAQLPCKVFRGSADGTFTDVTAAMSPDDPDGFNVEYPCGSPWGVVAGDFDADGDLDLVFPCGGFNFDSPNTYLRNNGDGTFTNTSAAAGLVGKRVTFALVSLDYDRDGALDLYEVNASAVLDSFYQGTPNPDARDRLWWNSPTGFQDRSAQAGVDLAGNGFSATAADLDRDGWLDLALSCFRQFNKVFYNRGNGTFSFMTPDGAPTSFDLGDLPPDPAFPGTVDFAEIPPGFDGLLPMEGIWSMPVDVRDLNADGWLDVLFQSWSSQLSDNNEFSAENGQFFPWDEARLYLNRGDQDGDGRGDGLFREAAQELGIPHVGGAMGALAVDLNGDGFDDVYVGGGGPQLDKHLEEDYVYVQEPGAWPADFQADPDQPLEQVFYEVGALAGSYPNIFMAHGLSAFRGPSGRLDVLVGNGGPALFSEGQENVYFRNTANSDGSVARFLEVELAATLSAPGAYGTRVEVVRDGADELGRVLVRESRSASVFASHDGAPERFAIGDGGALFVGLEWPSGVRSGELLWPAQAGVQSLSFVEPTLSVDLQVEDLPAGGVRLELEVVEHGAQPVAGSVFFLTLHPTGLPGLFVPLLFLEVANPAVFAPGAPFQVGNTTGSLPLGLYAVLVIEPGTTDVIGASAKWYDPLLAGASTGAGGSSGPAGPQAAAQHGSVDPPAADAPERVPRTHVAPARTIALDAPWIELAPARVPLLWERVSTAAEGSRRLPSGDVLSWDAGRVELTLLERARADVSFQGGAPVVVTGRAMGCCEQLPKDEGVLLRFGRVTGDVAIDGRRFAPDGTRRP